MKFIQQYLSNRKKITNIDDACKSWKQIFNGIPQVSILGTLIIIIFLLNLYCFLDGVSEISYTDDTTTYKAKETKDLVKK